MTIQRPKKEKLNKSSSLNPLPQMNDNDKLHDLDKNRTNAQGETLTTNQGLPIVDNQNSLKAGERGPALLEDFIFREKITHFDHERIPERVVHARGEAAHGFFQVYKSMAKYTKARFLQDPDIKTPVFVRFSTVGGSRGSADTVRDVRGFAVKFYTQEGNYDLVGNNIPVFFIQDAIKFPDLVHALKPEPHHEMPQASSAHDTFWDFISLLPESMHMIMWIMSDRAIPRSLRMMEGFGVHTFRFINEKEESFFVKFHWKPLLGVHSLAWDEAQKLAGKDPDFHRRDLWEAIELGNYPEWELGVQIIPQEDEFKFDFDLLDPTKLLPEETVPVTPLGKMTLNRNPDNFFAETEQVAFHLGHVVPGIDFTNDPLLQGRLFSYTDTQLIRLGGPNFQQLPINRPVCPFHNNQREGYGQHLIPTGRVAYEPNSLANGFPQENPEKKGGFVSYHEKIDGEKIRKRSDSFSDHFSQATMFWLSQSKAEQEHIIAALRFELSKVEVMTIRERMIGLLSNVDNELASKVAANISVKYEEKNTPSLKNLSKNTTISPALSMQNSSINTIKTRKIAILSADGVEGESINFIKDELEKAGAQAKIISSKLGTIKSINCEDIKVDYTFTAMPSIMFDAVLIPGGNKSIAALLKQGEAIHFVYEAFKHCKPLAFCADSQKILSPFLIDMDEKNALNEGLIFIKDENSLKKGMEDFINSIAKHRQWERSNREAVPA